MNFRLEKQQNKTTQIDANKVEARVREGILSLFVAIKSFP